MVRITNTFVDPDYRVPWNGGAMNGALGTGFVINGSRIMTNAHVISNTRFLTAERENDPKKYVAHVEFVAHDCDLAVLKVDDANFFKGMVPLDFGPLPEIESAVSVFGYPIGGDRLSVTRGIVSRVDFQLYTHSGVDSHLAVQIDAAINPGNSGGPVLQNGMVVGVAFQGYSGDVAQNTGYMIPTPVIRRFLKDIEDGHYDRYMDLSMGTFNLQNPSQRAALGLPDDVTGVMVSDVQAGGVSQGQLEIGDVLLSIDGHPIESDGTVNLDGSQVLMSEVVERKFKNDLVKLGLQRAGQKKDVTIKLAEAWPYNLQASEYDHLPRYVLFGGLLFQPLSRDFMDAYQPDDLRLRYFYDYYISDQLYLDHPEVIVLSAILPDPINAYLGDFQNGILDEVNGTKIRTLKDAASAFAKPADEYVIKLLGQGRPLVLEAAAVKAAHDRILTRYHVPGEQNLGDNQ
ncbi:MAG: trypsin-like peptidase domain-containing protein [Chthoniobacteraceae bacterium]